MKKVMKFKTICNTFYLKMEVSMMITTTLSLAENAINLVLSGRLDTVTSLELSNQLGKLFEVDFNSLVFDFSSLDYISSAGLNVLQFAQENVNSTGAEMKIIGASEPIKEMLEITGLSGIVA